MRLMDSMQPVWAGEGTGDGSGATPEATVTGAEGTTQETVEQEPAKIETKPDAEAEAKVEEKVEAQPAPKPDWRDQQIARLRDQLAREKAKPVEAKPDVKPDPNSDFESRVATAAAQQRRVDDFNAACLKAATAGRSAYSDFDTRLRDITSNLVDQRDPASVIRYNQFLSDTIEAADGDPNVVAKVIYELGSDLNEADRVMGLSSVKRGAELAKLSSREAAEVSSAPKPITPVAARGDKHESIKASDPSRADGLSTASWMERREAEVQAQAKARMGMR